MKIVITAGGTSEAIDKVRKITNMSKGTLGKALASVAEVHPDIDTIYFLSPFSESEKDSDAYVCPGKFVWVQTTSVQSVHDELHRILTTEKIDAVIHAMAVSDYTVDYACSVEDMVRGILNHLKGDDEITTDDLLEHGYMKKRDPFEDLVEFVKKGDFRLNTSSKMSSKSENVMIKLKPTEKIISKIKKWSPDSLLVGFKLLENVSKEELLSVGRGIMEKNSCGLVFANDIRLIREGGHQGFLIAEEGTVTELKGLDSIAEGIVAAVTQTLEGRGDLHA